LADHQESRGIRSPYLVATTLGALGVVYGDIGTSPLYALREAFVAAESMAVTRANVLGVLSLILWALVLVVSLKYLVFVLRADNEGEGGILALTALLLDRRFATKRLLIVIGLFGTALLYGDGMITPAISVLAAVEGMELAIPSLEQFVVPVAVLILVGLFSVQRRGTASIGAVFGPIMLVWFSVIGLLGASHIADDLRVLGAVNPGHAVSFAVANPQMAFLALGAIFLVVTGSEALYADMGHFGKRPIRLGWAAIVFPSLLLNYFGQGALILADPAAVESPFFRMAPSWSLVPLVILATMATVIASQALISGAYSLTMQAIQLGYLPRQRVDHTSRREYGQVYIGSVNWLLMVATVALVIGFGSSTNLAAAYGVAVTTTMVITTVLLYVVMRKRWEWGRGVSLALTMLFLVVDLAFFSANIVKVPAGGWVPLLVGLAVFFLMETWRRGRQLVTQHLRRGELQIEDFVSSIAANPQRRVPGTAVYLYPDPGGTPPAILANLQHNGVLHETVLVVAVAIRDRPRVERARRATVHDMGEGFSEVLLQFGFSEDPDVPTALGNIVTPSFGFDSTDATYFLGRETVVSTPGPGMPQWRERLFAFMQRNATSAVRFFGLPADRVIEIGVQVDI